MPIILCVFLLVSLVAGISPAIAQAEVPFGIRAYWPILYANNPYAPFIRMFPTLESGRLVLELRNDFHEPVRLEDVVLKEGDRLTRVLEEQRELYPAERVLIDITEELRDLFAENGSQTQERVVGISLFLEPVPGDQPEPSRYRVTLEEGQLADFTRIEETL